MTVLCKDCRWKQWWTESICRPPNEGCINPITGKLMHLYCPCMAKNHNLDCKDFQPRTFWWQRVWKRLQWWASDQRAFDKDGEE